MANSGKQVMKWYRLYVFGMMSMFPPTVIVSFNNSTYAVQVNWILLSEGQYLC